MDRFIQTVTDEADRPRLLKLLAKEQQKQKDAGQFADDGSA